MDIARPEAKRQKRSAASIYIAAAVVLIPLVTYALSRLKPAAPSVDRATVWTDTVKRGPMLREVRGLGTLVPETIRLIPAVTDGTVETRYLLPGTPVKADTVISGHAQSRNYSRPRSTRNISCAARKRRLNNTKAQLQNQLMDKRAQAAAISFRLSHRRIAKGQQRKTLRARTRAQTHREDVASAGRRTEQAKRHCRESRWKRSPIFDRRAARRPAGQPWTKSARCTT